MGHYPRSTRIRHCIFYNIFSFTAEQWSQRRL